MPVISRLDVTVVNATVRDAHVRFAVHNAEDVIQRPHRAGRFYEEQELAIIERFFPRGGCYVDIGANVGNHVIYVSKFLAPSRIVMFEPVKEAIDILELNLALNGIDTRPEAPALLHKCGLGARRFLATPVIRPNNLGASRLTEAETGAGIRVEVGDEMLRDEPVDFLKIDVEGMEMDVLAGLKETIARCSPAMFVEVANRNMPPFEEFAAANGYTIAERFRRYDSSDNYLIHKP